PVRRALRAVSPTALVSVENVTSPVLVQEAKRMGILTLLVSGLMSKNVQLHPLAARTMEMLPYNQFDWIGAKSWDDVQGFIALGANPSQTIVTGNMKFDLDYLSLSAEERKGLCTELFLDPQDPVFLAASLHPGEEEFVGKAYLELAKIHPSLRLIVVPRYQFHVVPMAEVLNGLGLSCITKSELTNGRIRDHQVILVDTFGELSRLYSVASAVFIGGSTYLRNVVGFGQNIIEPLVYQKPLFFGTYMNLWREITEELRKEWPGVQVSSSEELASGLDDVLVSPDLRSRLQIKAAEIIGRHRDDVRCNVELVRSAVSQRFNDFETPDSNVTWGS
ncbi:MAG: 3-deoxy-D-manno-octulosonic acid transferase, partial [Candidatus Binatia bacterium]